MKIGIDMRAFYSLHHGTREYLRQLLIKFQKLDTQNEFFLFAESDFDFPVFNPLWHRVIEQCNYEKSLTNWDQIVIPYLLKKYKIPWLWKEEELVVVEDNLITIVPNISPHHYFRFYSEIKENLQKISPCFCLAKWLQVTLHLENGFTHSCHHPNAHKIPLDEVRKDPSALHNTTFNKLQRRMMLEGKRPPECLYCWNTEDLKDMSFSDRILKSADPWAYPFLKEVASHHWNKNIKPTYLEVSFGNECNFRCAYCAPDISSPIWREFEKHGNYPTSTPVNDLGWMRSQGREPYLKSKNNPYLKAFWKWFPTIFKNLHVFRITGGEPLINPNTFKILDYIDKNPHPRLQLSINTNMCVPDKNYKIFLKKTAELLKNKKIRKFVLYASIDTYGLQAEYIRFGLDYKIFLKNVCLYLDCIPGKLTFMVTFNILSIPGFINFLQDIVALRKKYDIDPETIVITGGKLFLDIAYLRFPDYLSVQFINNRLLDQVRKIQTFMVSNSKLSADGTHRSYGFSEYEINKITRIISWIQNSHLEEHDLVRLQTDFYRFIVEYDHRKGTNFLSTFPELTDFYQTCKGLFQQSTGNLTSEHKSL